MEPLHRQTQTIWTQLFCIVVVLLSSSIQLVQSGCRPLQERNPCETICQWNATRKSYDCTLRVIVILPEKDTVEASLPRVIINCYFFAIANVQYSSMFFCGQYRLLKAAQRHKCASKM